MNQDCWDLVVEFAFSCTAAGCAFRATSTALRNATTRSVASIIGPMGGLRLDEAAVGRLKERLLADSTRPTRLFRWAVITCGPYLHSLSFVCFNTRFPDVPTFRTWLVRPEDQHGTLKFVNVEAITDISADISALFVKPGRGKQPRLGFSSRSRTPRRDYRNLHTLRIVISRDWYEKVPKDLSPAAVISGFLKKCDRRPAVCVIAVGEYSPKLGFWVRPFGACLRRFVFRYSSSWTTETVHDVLSGDVETCDVVLDGIDTPRNLVFSSVVRSVTADSLHNTSLSTATPNENGEPEMQQRTIAAEALQHAFLDLSDLKHDFEADEVSPDVAVLTLSTHFSVQWTPRPGAAASSGSSGKSAFSFARLSSVTLQYPNFPAIASLQAAIEAGRRRSFPSLTSLDLNPGGTYNELALWIRALDAPNLTTLRLAGFQRANAISAPFVFPPALTHLSLSFYDASDSDAPVVCGPNLTALTVTYTANLPTVRLPPWVKQITNLRRLHCRSCVLLTPSLLEVMPTLRELEFIPADNDIDVVLQHAQRLSRLTLLPGRRRDMPMTWLAPCQDRYPIPVGVRELTLHQPLCSVSDVEQIARRFPRIHTLELRSERPMHDAVWGALRAVAYEQQCGGGTFGALSLVRSHAPIPSCKVWPREADDRVEIVAM